MTSLAAIARALPTLAFLATSGGALSAQGNEGDAIVPNSTSG
jgi:hypothetical protein